MSDPLVSIIIPTFNRPVLLGLTLDDLQAQDYPAKEVIVVDGGAEEGIGEIRQICESRSARYVRQEDSGISCARNLGFNLSHGELILFQDDDDLCPPGSLRARVAHWQSEPDSDHVIGKLRRFWEPEPGKMEFIEPEDQTHHYMILGAEMMTRRAFARVGGFDPAILRSEDTDLFLRTREAGMKLKFIPEICLFYRRHPGNITHNLDQADKTMLSVLHMTMQRRRREREQGQGNGG